MIYHGKLNQVQDIVETVRRLSDLVGPDGCVFTSGGIGNLVPFYPIRANQYICW